MPGNKRTRKAYRPKNVGSAMLKTQPWRAEAVFGPLEAVLAQIEQSGTVTTDGEDMPVFLDPVDGCWYATAPALEGIVDAYQTHELRSGRPMPIENLHRLARNLESANPVSLADCEAIRRDIAILRRETMSMTVDYADSLVKTTQIKIELQEQESHA